MNYEKKRKRQSGRQARQMQDSYQVWIDDECKIHATLVKARKREAFKGFAHMKSITKEEFAKDFT